MTLLPRKTTPNDQSRQGLKQAIIVVPEKSIGSSFHDEPLSKHGFWADWTVKPKWNLCDAPGEDGGKVNSVGAFLESGDSVLVCTHATFRFAVDRLGVPAFDNRLIAVDEFHHVSSNPDNKLGSHLGDFIARDKVHIVAMTGSYFRGATEAVLSPLAQVKMSASPHLKRGEGTDRIRQKYHNIVELVHRLSQPGHWLTLQISLILTFMYCPSGQLYSTFFSMDAQFVRFSGVKLKRSGSPQSPFFYS